MHRIYFLILLFVTTYIQAESVHFDAQEVVEPVPFPHRGCIHSWQIEARIGKQIVGTARLSLPYNKRTGVPLYTSVYVNKLMRGLNLGTLLFEKAYEYACTNGYTHLIMSGTESAESFNFVKKIMKNHVVEFEQDETDSSRWIVKIASK